MTGHAVTDPSASRLKTLLRDAPGVRVEISKLRPKRFLSFDRDPVICSDNPHYDGYRKPQFSLKVPAVKRVRVRDAALQFPQHLIRVDDQLYFDLCINRHAEWRDQTPRQIPGHTRIGTNSTFHNFYHWMAECLPSLTHHVGEGARVLMPTLSTGWQEHTLKAAGLAEATGDTAGREIIEVDSLEFLTTAMHDGSGSYCGGLMADEAVSTFARIAERPEVTALEGCLPRHIFISRRDARKRPFDDESRVARLLRPMGFEEVVLSEFGTLEQVALFRGAHVIVAAHGAGLVQTAYCRPGTRVFEIQHPSCRSSLFLRMALQFGLVYAMYQEFDPNIAADARMLNWSIRDFRHLQETLFRFLDSAA